MQYERFDCQSTMKSEHRFSQVEGCLLLVLLSCRVSGGWWSSVVDCGLWSVVCGYCGRVVACCEIYYAGCEAF